MSHSVRAHRGETGLCARNAIEACETQTSLRDETDFWYIKRRQVSIETNPSTETITTIMAPIPKTQGTIHDDSTSIGRRFVDLAKVCVGQLTN